MPNENDLMGVGMNGLSTDPALHPFGVIPDGSVPDAGSNMTDEQATQQQMSQANNMKRLGTGGGRDGRSMVGPGGRASFDQSYGVIASAMPSGMNPSLAFSVPNGQNGHSYNQGYNIATHGNGTNMPQASTDALSTLPNARSSMPGFTGANGGQQAGLDWSHMFQPNSHDSFISPYNSQVQVKTEPSLNISSNGLFTGVYPSVPNGVSNGTGLPHWNLQHDPLQTVSDRLLFLCFPPNTQISGRSNEIRKYLSADNIKHFLEHFTNFQGHFPVIHMPTFRITDAYDGLLLGMICIGAVYSDRLTAVQVREMMELAKVVIEQNSQVYIQISQEYDSDAAYGNDNLGASKSELEQITAIYMMQVLFVWHGTPVQREKARREFPLVVALAKRARLTQPMTTSPCSVLHQATISAGQLNAASFDWNTWVEQEKRSRLLYTIFLVDATMVICFNATPRFDTLEIRLPLPADDAAWDARTASECAEALGLNGPVAAREVNAEGSRRAKQPEMHTALRALMHNVYDLQPGTTNLYSKFILIHALHVQLWTAQKQLSQETGQFSTQSLAIPSSGTSTPIGQNDWVTRGIDPTGSGAPSSNTSGRATPADARGQSPMAHQLLKAINNAFDKWKTAWDEDMATQYPPSSTSHRRFGFCRDAVHFYWLAKYLLKNNRGLDWQMAPDQRFSQVMHLLKSVRTWVVSDSANRGEELGSVCDIDKDYGFTDLTLDMAQLYKPINKQIDSHVAGVHTNIISGIV